jgi:hypothetical protein
MVPGPWVIVETPTRHHPRRRGRPIPRRLFAWMVRASKDSSTVAGAHLRWLGSRARGDPQKQRRHHARTRRGLFGNPSLFCAPTAIARMIREDAGRRSYSPATRPGASPPTSPSCRSFHGRANTDGGNPDRLACKSICWCPLPRQSGRADDGCHNSEGGGATRELCLWRVP